MLKVLSLKLAQSASSVSVGPADAWSLPLLEGSERELIFQFRGPGRCCVSIHSSRHVVVEPSSVVSLSQGSPVGKVKVKSICGGSHCLEFTLTTKNALFPVIIRPNQLTFTTPFVEKRTVEEAAEYLAYTHANGSRDAFVLAIRHLLNVNMTSTAQILMVTTLVESGFVLCAVDVLVWLHSTKSEILKALAGGSVWGGIPLAHMMLLAGHPQVAISMNEHQSQELLSLAAQCCDGSTVRELVKHCGTKTSSRFEGETPLGFAIVQQWVEGVQMYVDAGFDVNEITKRNVTPLQDIADLKLSGPEGTVRATLMSILLSSNRVKFDMQDPQTSEIAACNTAAFFRCMRRGYVVECCLIGQFHVSFIEPSTGLLPVLIIVQFTASVASEADCITILSFLRKKFPESITASATHSSIHNAATGLILAVRACLVEITRFLLRIEASACVAVDSLHMTPLHHACILKEEDHSRVLEIALALRDATRGQTRKLEIPDVNGNFPLHTLCSATDVNGALFELMVVTWKMRVDGCNKAGQTPLHLLLENPSVSPTDLLQYCKLIIDALDGRREKDFARRDTKNGWNVLHHALVKGNFLLAQMLLRDVAPLYREYLLDKTTSGCSALWLALEFPGSRAVYDCDQDDNALTYQLVSLVLEYRQQMTSSKESLIHRAAARGHTEICKALLISGLATSYQMAGNTLTPLHAALCPCEEVPDSDVPFIPRHSPEHESRIILIIQEFSVPHANFLARAMITLRPQQIENIIPLQLACHLGLCEVVEFLLMKMSSFDCAYLSDDDPKISPPILFMASCVSAHDVTPQRRKTLQRLLISLINRFGANLSLPMQISFLRDTINLGYRDVLVTLLADIYFREVISMPLQGTDVYLLHYVVLCTQLDTSTQIEIFHDILKHGATMIDVSVIHSTGSLLHHAIRLGSHKLVKELVQKFDMNVNMYNDFVRPPVEFLLTPDNTVADEQGIIEMLETIVASDTVDVQLITINVYLAVSQLLCPKLFFLLRNHGFPIPRFPYDDTFLHMIARVPYQTSPQAAAAITFATEMLWLDLNVFAGPDTSPVTPLMLAASLGNAIVVKELLALGAKADLKNVFDESAMHYLLTNPSLSTDTITEMTLSLAHKYYLSSQLHQRDSRKGMAPVHYLFARGVPCSLLETLVDRSGGLDVHLRDGAGLTLLHHLIRTGIPGPPYEKEHLSLVQRLLSLGKFSLSKEPLLIAEACTHPWLTFARTVLQFALKPECLGGLDLVSVLHAPVESVPLPFYLVSRVSPQSSVDDVYDISAMLVTILATGAVKSDLSHSGVTLLYQAAERGLTEVVASLLTLGADPNNQNNLPLRGMIGVLMNAQPNGDSFSARALTQTALNIMMDAKFLPTAFPYVETILDVSWNEYNLDGLLQILRQLLKAYSTERKHGHSGSYLHHVLLNALPVSKKIPYLKCLVENWGKFGEINSAAISPRGVRGPWDMTPLSLAIHLKFWEVVTLLTASPQCDLFQHNPLHRAIRADMETCEATECLITLLGRVVRRGNIFAIEDGDASTIFTLAARRGDYLFLDAVLSQGCNPLNTHEASNALVTLMNRNVDEEHILPIAAKMFSAHEAKFLSEQHDPPTCLHSAARKGYRQLAVMLMGYGFRPSHEDVFDAMGKTPLHCAFEYAGPDRTELCMDLLRHAPPKSLRLDLSIKTNGQTLLMLAARASDTPLVKELLKRGVKSESVDHSGTTALLHALETEDPEEPLVQCLLTAQSVTYQRPTDGVKPIHLAARCAMTKVIKQIVELGEAVAVADASGRLPVHYCLASCGGAGRAETLELLLSLHQQQRSASAFQCRDPSEITDIQNPALLSALLSPLGVRAIPWLEKHRPVFIEPSTPHELTARVTKYRQIILKQNINPPTTQTSHSASTLTPLSVDDFFTIFRGCNPNRLLGASHILSQCFFFPFITKSITMGDEVQVFCEQHADGVNNLTPVLAMIVFRVLGSKIAGEYLANRALGTTLSRPMLVDSLIASVVFASPSWLFHGQLMRHVSVLDDACLQHKVMFYGYAPLVAAYLRELPTTEGIMSLFFVRSEDVLRHANSVAVFRVMMDFRVPMSSERAVTYVQQRDLTKSVNIFGDTIIHLAAMSNFSTLAKLPKSQLPDCSAENHFLRKAGDYCITKEMEGIVRGLEVSAQHEKSVEFLRSRYQQQSNHKKKNEQQPMVPKPPTAQRTRVKMCTKRV